MRALTREEFELLSAISNSETNLACRRLISHKEIALRDDLFERGCVGQMEPTSTGPRRPITYQGRVALQLHASLIARGLAQ